MLEVNRQGSGGNDDRRTDARQRRYRRRVGKAPSEKLDSKSCNLNYAQVHLGPLGNLFYNSKDAELRAPRTASQESPKW